MANRKIEPRLEAHIDQEKARASAGGMAAAAVDDMPIPVTISHGDMLRAQPGTEGAAGLESMGPQAMPSQQPLLERLRSLKAPDITTYALANAVTTRLTPRQIAAVAEMDEVRMIRLEALDMVTCMQHSAHVIESVDAASDFAASGRGIKVAILDSGVDANHPALLGKVVDEISTTPEPVNVPGSHGTHVAGRWRATTSCIAASRRKPTSSTSRCSRRPVAGSRDGSSRASNRPCVAGRWWPTSVSVGARCSTGGSATTPIASSVKPQTTPYASA